MEQRMRKIDKYALAGAPELSPLSFETKTGELDVPETLAGRLKLSLSERSRFAYGAYGEIYSTGTEYSLDRKSVV